MGIKHLRKIERIFKENPDKSFPLSYFTNYEKIDYSTAIQCIEYLWEQKKLELIPPRGRYKWKNKI